MVSAALPIVLLRGLKFIVRADPSLPNLGYARIIWKLRKSAKAGAVPGLGFWVRSGLTLLKRDYNPADEGSTAQAVAYLASSPAARAFS